MNKKLLLGLTVLLGVFIFSCEKEVPNPTVYAQEPNCNYHQYTKTFTCNPGYYPVAFNSCCPGSAPYLCKETGTCHETACAAEEACVGGTIPSKINR